MKKTIALCAAILFAAVSANAALDAYDTLTNTVISTMKVASGVQTNAYVDVSQAKGICRFSLMIGPAYTNSATFGASATLKTSATTNGTYVTVTNGAGNAVALTGNSYNGTGTVSSIKVEAENLKRYVRLFTVATNDTCNIGAVLLYSK